VFFYRCFNGCANCTGVGKYLYPKSTDFPPGCTLAEPTNNDPATRSWDPHGQSAMGDFTKYNPWRSPGKAPVHDPCGAASGYKVAGQGPYAPEVPLGYPVWSKGSEVLPPGNVTVWKAGGLAEVSWSIAAQHGGGYQYRLCPKGSKLSEECFQAHPLAFEGTTHTIRYNDGSAPSLLINATSLSTGVLPHGSTWRRNPIPACNCDIGACKVGGKGFSKPYANSPDPISADECPTGTMFNAQFKGGAGDVGYLTGRPVLYSIVDKVKVPEAVGDYVLSWRWDCEETNQVWNSCADIRISDHEPPTPPPPPAPPAPPTPPKPPPKGKGCKAGENPTCKGLGSKKKGMCIYYGCKQCHDDVSWDCDECCDACSRTLAPKKGIHYCADRKAMGGETLLPGFMLHAAGAAAGVAAGEAESEAEGEAGEDPLRAADPNLMLGDEE
jgi:hypothetical protein